MKWKYMLTTPTIWASFDFGEVEADTEAQAIAKALTELKTNLDKVNGVLDSSETTRGFTVSMDFSQLEIAKIN
jgi:hypothetical protein